MESNTTFNWSLAVITLMGMTRHILEFLWHQKDTTTTKERLNFYHER